MYKTGFYTSVNGGTRKVISKTEKKSCCLSSLFRTSTCCSSSITVHCYHTYDCSFCHAALCTVKH